MKIVCLALAALLLIQVARALRPVAGAGGSMLIRAVAEDTGQEEPQSTAADRPVPSGGIDTPKLQPATEAKVDFIVQNELFGPIPRPLPMALIGIAGSDVMLRSPTGQTGLIREGEELGGVRLLRVGTNRVLVLHEGETRELVLFSGYGSESLLSQDKEAMK